MACMPPWKRLRWILLAAWLGACAMGAACSGAAWLPASRELWGISLPEVLTVLGTLGLLCLAMMSLVLLLVCGIKAVIDRRIGLLPVLLLVALPFVLLSAILVLRELFPTRA